MIEHVNQGFHGFIILDHSLHVVISLPSLTRLLPEFLPVAKIFYEHRQHSGILNNIDIAPFHARIPRLHLNPGELPTWSRSVKRIGSARLHMDLEGRLKEGQDGMLVVSEVGANLSMKKSGNGMNLIRDCLDTGLKVTTATESQIVSSILKSQLTSELYSPLCLS